jgi:hypothetical protein
VSCVRGGLGEGARNAVQGVLVVLSGGTDIELARVLLRSPPLLSAPSAISKRTTVMLSSPPAALAASTSMRGRVEIGPASSIAAGCPAADHGRQPV